MPGPPGFGSVASRARRSLFAGMVALALAAGCERKASLTPADLAAGKDLFLSHCSGCHPGGGNVKYPAKSLDRLTLVANGITSPDGIVRKMRHPDPGMTRFDRKTLRDIEARRIAAYVWATFK